MVHHSSAVHPPKQSRSRRTLERIRRAALEILDEQGPEGLTVQAIVARARSSVGSFYARFDGKDDLIADLGEQMWVDAATRWDEALAVRSWDGRSLAELADGVVALLADTRRADVLVLRALEATGGGGDAARRFRAHVRRGLADVLLSRRDEMDHPRPEVAVDVGIVSVSALLDTPRSDLPRAVDEAQLRHEAACLLRSYLQAAEPERRESTEGVDFFDVWA